MYRYEQTTGKQAVFGQEPTLGYLEYERRFFANIGPRGLKQEQESALVADGVKRANQFLSNL